MRRYLTLLLLFSLSYSQEIIGEGLTGQPLLDYVVDNYKPSTTLGYNAARDTLYASIDLKENNQLSCVYSGYTITIDTSLDPSTDAYNQGINCEHTYPQSMGAGEEPQKSDMHHLYPCKSNVNSSRGNDPYAEIPDEDTDTWYRNDYSQDTIPDEFIDEFAEKNNPPNPDYEFFEPREDHKGDASRAVFYFFAIYNDVADTNFWNVQKDVLLDWHYYDPVNDWELNRTWAIASYQENQPNPFILDSSLARRIWYMDDSGTDTSTTDTVEYYIVINEIMQNPLIVGDSEGEWFEIYNNSNDEINLSGFTIKDKDSDSHLITDSVSVGAYSFAVLGRNNDMALNGGVHLDYQYEGINLANGEDEIVLIDPYGLMIDSVAYDDGIMFPDPNGATMALINIELDNSIGSNWVEYDSLTYGNGDYGTPGFENFPVDELCDSGYVEIDSMCYWQEDIDVLQTFINNSQESSTPPPDSLSPIELGYQEWEFGRLTALCVTTGEDWCGDYVLGGELPVNISNLTELAQLNLYQNEISGALPEGLFELLNLQNLFLDHNQISDTLSQNISNLINLEYLNLSNNDLSGNIPIELGEMHYLKELLLGYNSIGDTIPFALFELPNLEALHLNDNQLTGSIPSNIENLTNLVIMNLSANQLEGRIPEGVSSNFLLLELHLGENQLSGTIPEEIWDMINLESLFLDNNEFSGDIPDAVRNLTNLYALSLYDNQFSGVISDSICNLTRLEELNLWDNQFCPPYPDCISGESLGDQDTSDCEPLSLDEKVFPEEFKVHQNFPNPFNPRTTIKYRLPKDTYVTVRIFDLNGRMVTTLTNQQENAGYKVIAWDSNNHNGKPVSAGVYLCEIKAGDFKQVKKMVLLK